MKAVTWHAKRKISVDTVPDPIIKEPNDAIINITWTGICGSDLHLYETSGPFWTRATSSATSRWVSSRRSVPRSRHEARRPGGDPVHHRVRPLLHVRRAA